MERIVLDLKNENEYTQYHKILSYVADHNVRIKISPKKSKRILIFEKNSLPPSLCSLEEKQYRPVAEYISGIRGSPSF